MKQSLNLMHAIFGLLFLLIPLNSCGENNGAAPTPEASCPAPSFEHDLVITDVNIIPMDQQIVLEHRTVFIKDGQISKIEPTSAANAIFATRVVDGQGKYLIPGLADMHVHIWSEFDGPVYIANGVTTIRNMWGIPWHLMMRELFAWGGLIGPELHTTGPIMDGNPPVWEGSLVVDTLESAAKSVREQVARGYEAIKVYNNLKTEVYQEIIKVAAENKISVVGHVPDSVGLATVIKAGQKSNEHLSKYNLEATDDAEELLTVEKGMWNCPTLVMWDHWNRLEDLRKQPLDELKYVHPDTLKEWQNDVVLPSAQAKLQRKLKSLVDHGAPIIAGTDAWAPYVVAGFSLHEEFTLMVQAGMTPYQVLRASTYNAAQFLGTLARSGTIEVGKTADLVLLDANPLVNIANTKNPTAVILHGRYFARPELDQMLDRVARTYAAMK